MKTLISIVAFTVFLSQGYAQTSPDSTFSESEMILNTSTGDISGTITIPDNDGTKPDAKLLIIENMNHVLKESDSDIQMNMATYSNSNLPLKPGLTDEIVNFIKK